MLSQFGSLIGDDGEIRRYSDGSISAVATDRFDVVGLAAQRRDYEPMFDL